jgi:hypothetical protein
MNKVSSASKVLLNFSFYFFSTKRNILLSVTDCVFYRKCFGVKVMRIPKSRIRPPIIIFIVTFHLKNQANTDVKTA